MCERYGDRSIDYVSINWDISESDLCGQVLILIDWPMNEGPISFLYPTTIENCERKK